MKGFERRKDEGKAEYLARLGVIKSVGFAALTAAGAVLIPPLAVPLTAATIAEGLGIGGFGIAHQHLKGKRLKNPRA